MNAEEKKTENQETSSKQKSKSKTKRKEKITKVTGELIDMFDLMKKPKKEEKLTKNKATILK